MMDKAAWQCKEAGLVLPDEVMVYLYLWHANASMERQANILVRTGGEYDWKKVKQAVGLLYLQAVTQRRDRDSPGKQHRKGRCAHETHGDWKSLRIWTSTMGSTTRTLWRSWTLFHLKEHHQSLKGWPENFTKCLPHIVKIEPIWPRQSNLVASMSSKTKARARRVTLLLPKAARTRANANLKVVANLVAECCWRSPRSPQLVQIAAYQDIGRATKSAKDPSVLMWPSLLRSICRKNTKKSTAARSTGRIVGRR